MKMASKEGDKDFNLKTICDALGRIKTKWFETGIQLGIPRSKLLEFKEECDPLSAVIDYWLQGNVTVPVIPISWESFVAVLKSEHVGEPGLAEEISKQYCKIKNNEDEKVTGASSAVASEPLTVNPDVQMDPDVKIDLENILERNLDTIITKYSDYVDCIRTIIEEKGLSPETLCSCLLSLSASSRSYKGQKLTLMSDKKDELKKNNTITDIFDFLVTECASFLNYDIFQKILKKFKISEDREELKYSEHLNTFIEKHKISEFVKVNPLLKSLNGSEKLILKFDVETTCTLAKVVELKRFIAKILNLKSLTLLIVDIEEGCVVVTFHIPASVANAIFTPDTVFTSQQENKFQAASVVWLKCNDHTFNFGKQKQETSYTEIQAIKECMVDHPTKEYIARPYQIKLLEAALEENTIVNLGTGAGKTYIAVMLIKELSPEIILHGKKSVFLVTTVPLVKQQASYISLHTNLKVGHYSGEKSKHSFRWQQEIENHQVLVMTMAIFLNLILENHISFSDINLLVFDECHHAVKKHIYVQIMSRFNSDKARAEGTMRILGLTASLIPSKCRPGDLELKISDLEKTLCCRSQTAEDLQEVAKYATNPEEIRCEYRSSDSDHDVLMLKNVLEDPVNFLESFTTKNRLSEFYEIVKMNLEDCLHILLNLGIWCAHQFAVIGLEDITNRTSQCFEVYNSKWEKMLLHLGRTYLTMFIQESQHVLSQPSKRFHIVEKVQKLLLHLGDSAIQSGEVGFNQESPKHEMQESTERLLGIIFTERRTTAALLCKLLQLQSKMAPDLQHIQCDYVVGHDPKAGSTYLRREARMTMKQQDSVLDKFRSGKINLLVSTSVVEEGVDVPKCNTVIRFDFPQNFRSYVQSKGRARARRSKYILLIPKEEVFRLKGELRDYNTLVKELERICHKRHVIEDNYKHLKEMVEPYTNKTGAKATLNSSLGLVHKYCQMFPRDRYTISAPHFKFERRQIVDTEEGNPCRVPQQDVEYQSTITFPIICPVKEPIKGLWLPTKRWADKSAALEAIKRLDKAGELDPHLNPIVRADDPDMESLNEEEEQPQVYMEQKACYYHNLVPEALQNCLPRCLDWENHLYIFYISDATSGGLYLSQPDQAEQQLSFGILSNKPLPHLQIPEFSIYNDTTELHVKICKYHTTISLTERERKLLQDAHFALFSSILKIQPTWLKCDFSSMERNYLVVPLYFIPLNMEAYIAFDLAKKLASLKPSSPAEKGGVNKLTPVQWPIPVEEFQNSIVTEKNGGNTSTLLEVKKVSTNIVLSSPFSGSLKYSTYEEYFTEKYGCVFTDSNQPALVCEPLPDSEACLQLLTSHLKMADGTSIKKSDACRNTTYLFPETCNFYPLPADLWRLSHTIPSILWRVECFLTVNQLRTRIAVETGIGLFPDSTEVTTCINFQGYRDTAFGDLPSQRFTPNQEPEMVCDSSYDPLKPPLRGPNNTLLLQALTTKSARDSIDLERLKILGDSFFKFSTTVFLYHNFSTAHEGILSKARERRVSNRSLYVNAQDKGVASMTFSKGFNPRQMWAPPCFIFDVNDPYLTRLKTPSNESGENQSSGPLFVEETRYLYKKLTGKQVTSCVESLAGAYLVSGGISAGLKFMVWMGVKILAKESAAERPSASQMKETRMHPTKLYCAPSGFKQMKFTGGQQLPIFIRNSASILTEFFTAKLTVKQLDMKEEIELNRLLSTSLGHKNANEILGWHFKDRTLLLQAITHASYTKNRLTNCYQRLEFLGDAVLDYLVTCHIYSTFPRYGPGEISSMRSGLVNNFVFAEIAVEHGLHRALLYSSPSLYKQMELYLRAMENYFSTGVVGCEEVIVGNFASLENRSGRNSDVREECLDPPKVLGDILESIAGAIFIDSGMSLEAVWTIFQPFFDKKIVQVPELYNLVQA